jgi:uncharacterized protein (DUF1501 family)
LYSGDPVLAGRLADALAADAIADSPMMSAGDTMNTNGAVSTVGAVDDRASILAPAPRNKLEAARGGGARYAEVIHAAAEFLRRDDGPKVAVFDTTGWDTHANEGAAQGQLAGRLAALDSGLRTLKQQLGPVWNDTAVLLATEFGRTAAINGTRGTDHGTATAAFLVGGAVRGGRVIADWPGLSSRALYHGRDLMPTQDMRSVLKGVMEEHLLIPPRALDTTVFPDSGAAKALSGLVRT